MIKTKVVLFAYKRSDNLSAIMSVLRELSIREIYLVADGAKNDSELVSVNAVREQLGELIDWPCIVHKNYASSNLGLKERFRTGIDWVFSQEDRAIFLEDDCIPDPTFFRFCDELLEKYQDDKRVFSISGNNFQFRKNNSKYSYYFSRYPHIWGWATWKRSWDTYDSNLGDWGKLRQTNWLKDVTGGFIISKFWKYIFDRLSTGKINTWDYQLTYASFKNHGLNIIPVANLVTNIGYGDESTNIKSKNRTIGVKAVPMQFPLTHPKEFKADDINDRRIDNLVYLNTIGKISLVLKSILGLL
jgi:hypothetical protein